MENGPTYTGQWSGSKRDGHGTLFFEKGVFEGQWVQGNAHGKGMVHFKMLGWVEMGTLWWTYKKQLNMAIEIVDFPIKNGDFPLLC